jgi:hypothetical protein
MSTNDILRKYLDILNESDAATAAAPVTDNPSDQITFAPQQGNGSIKKVIEAVKEFQEEVGIAPADGVINPRTLAELLSQSGTMGKEEAEKFKAGAKDQSAADSEVVAEGIEGRGKHDMLADKAALHLGFAHGLMGEGHQCPHGVGTSAHSHYCHGHQEGLKECGTLPGGSSPTMAAPEKAGF